MCRPSDSEISYSATYHTIKVFTYITFRYNGARRPPLRQNYVAVQVSISDAGNNWLTIIENMNFPGVIDVLPVSTELNSKFQCDELVLLKRVLCG